MSMQKNMPINFDYSINTIAQLKGFMSIYFFISDIMSNQSKTLSLVPFPCLIFP